MYCPISGKIVFNWFYCNVCIMLIIQKPNDVKDVKHFTSCEIVNKFIVYSCEKHRVINNYILHVCLLLLYTT